MKRTLFSIFLLALPVLVSAQTRNHEKGTIIRMRMTDCMPQHHFMATMSGGAGIEPALQCPEYVLMSDKVVYAISGKTSNQLLPLAAVTRFRLENGEILIRIDDQRKESHFRVKAMILRAASRLGTAGRERRDAGGRPRTGSGTGGYQSEMK